MAPFQSVVASFVTAEHRLQETVARIPPDRWLAPSSNAGWTYKDLLAHLATGDWICQHLLHGLLETGAVPELPDADAGNAERVSARRGKLVSELGKERAQHRTDTIRLIAQLHPDHLDRPINMPWFNVRAAPFRVYLQTFPAHDRDHTQELIAIA